MPLHFPCASFSRALLGSDCMARTLFVSQKAELSPWVEPPDAHTCLVWGRRQELSPGYCLIAILPAQMKFPCEKYLHFPSHLLPEQLRCFPRGATFLLLHQLGGMLMEKSGAQVKVPLSPFLTDGMSWAVDILGWHSACFGNNPSSALLLCDVNMSMIPSPLHHIHTQQSRFPKLPCPSALSLHKINPKGARLPIL